MTSKKDLSERDICTKFITPALKIAGWNLEIQIREEVTFTDGKIIEAKDNSHSVSSGIQQALEYAKMLDIPSVYSSTGDGFYEHDRTVSSGQIERELALEAFPSPVELWRRYKIYKGIATPRSRALLTDF